LIINNKIKDIDFDCAVISAGAYSSLLFNYIVNTLHKKAYVIGGSLPLYFGIQTKRIDPKLVNEYFIKVPPEMRPDGYEKIEEGAYW
jgi:hypothetical protein